MKVMLKKEIPSDLKGDEEFERERWTTERVFCLDTCFPTWMHLQSCGTDSLINLSSDDGPVLGDHKSTLKFGGLLEDSRTQHIVILSVKISYSKRRKQCNIGKGTGTQGKDQGDLPHPSAGPPSEATQDSFVPGNNRDDTWGVLSTRKPQ